MASYSSDPLSRCEEWLQEAAACKDIIDHTAMSIATATAKGAPSVRMVLLKELSDEGFIFYTNLTSKKSKDIKENQHVAANFYWPALHRQIRIEGLAEPVSDAKADAYFATRPRDTQIGAWASDQSKPIEAAGALEQHIKDYIEKFDGKPIPRPPFWGGWLIIPQRIEFWTQGNHRIHKRECFTRTADGWEETKLYP